MCLVFNKGVRMTNCNGYNMVWNPNHHRASTNGMVYEHILEAEKMLGR